MKRKVLYLFWRLFRRLYLPLAMIFLNLIFGCVHTRHIPRHSSVNELDEINRKLAGRHARMVLKDGFRLLPEIMVQNVYVDVDSVHYIDTKTKKRNYISTYEVHKITLTDHPKGALKGCGIGLLIWGTIVGGTAIITSSMEDNSGGDCCPPEILVFYAAGVGAAIPVLFTLIGLGQGEQVIYVFTGKAAMSFHATHHIPTKSTQK